MMAAITGSLWGFAGSLVCMNMHSLFSRTRGVNPSCFSSLYVASSNSERSILPAVADFEKLGLEMEAVELHGLLYSVGLFQRKDPDSVSKGCHSSQEACASASVMSTPSCQPSVLWL